MKKKKVVLELSMDEAMELRLMIAEASLYDSRSKFI